MSMSRRVRIACVVAGVVALIGATGGITYASTSAAPAPEDTHAVACTNSTHGLRLMSNGKCPKGDSPIKVAAAPTPIVIHGTGSPIVNKTVSVGGFSFMASCLGEDTDNDVTDSGIYVNSTSGYDVQGSYIFTGDNKAIFATPPSNTNKPGSGQISSAATKSDPESTFYLNGNGGVTGDILIIQDGHTITVTFALFASANNCSVQAQIAPSS